MNSNLQRKRAADKILYEMGLWDQLCKIGQPHIIGSYKHIIRIKQELQECKLYGSYQYSSMDVYRAVLEQGITDTDDLLSRYIRTENKI